MHINIKCDVSSGAKRPLSEALRFDPSSNDEIILEATIANLDTLLLASRLHCLSKDEIYFLQSPEELRRPLNHRNEAAAVSLLLQRLALATTEQPNKEDHSTEDIVQLEAALARHCERLWPQFNDADQALCGTVPPPPEFPIAGSPSDIFHKWAEQQKINAAIQIASFDGLRGCAAVGDILPGQPILSIPSEALIYDETVKQTDLGRMLAGLPDLAMDNVLIIFSMIDRYEPESQWAPFWASLPSAFFTGLSFPPFLVDALEGTAAGLEIIRGQAHLRAQFEATKPLLDILLQAYPQYLQPEWFTYERYVWAAELWYSYAFEIEFPPSPKSKTVMVPFACHVNHSPWPHVVRYGRVNPATSTLDFPAFRPCPDGAQVFISYGPVPNLKLISYYGFSLDNNPHDQVPLTLEPPDGGLTQAQIAALDNLELGLEHNLRDGPLAKHLIACLRVVVSNEEEIGAVAHGKVDPRKGPISIENEKQALDTLLTALHAVLGPIQTAMERVEGALVEKRGIGGGGGGAQSLEDMKRNENGLDEDWQASLGFCRAYLEGQKRVVERSMVECEKLRANCAML